MLRHDIRRLFDDKVFELVEFGVTNFCRHFMDRILKAYDEVCVKKRGEEETKIIHSAGMKR